MTKLKGYQVVYYYNGFRLSAGNPQTFPTLKIAETYKKHHESYPWFHDELHIEEVEYEGEILPESEIYNGKEVIDDAHYYGLDACEINDYFSDELIMGLMDMLPPACTRMDCFQLGEAASHRLDEDKKCRATYPTFKKVDNGIWQYLGDCFRGENERRGKEIAYV